MFQWTEGARTLGSILRRAGAARIAAAFIAMAVGSVIGVLASVWVRAIVNGVVRHDMKSAFLSLAGIAASFAIESVLLIVGFALLRDIHERCGLVLTQERMRLTANLPGIEHFERPEYLDRLVLLSRGARGLAGVTTIAAQSVALISRAVVSAAVLFLLAPPFALLTLTVVPAVWSTAWGDSLIKRCRDGAAEESRRNQHLFSVMVSTDGASEVRLRGLAGGLVVREADSWRRITRAVFRGQVRAGAMKAAGWGPFVAGFIVSVALIASRAIHGDSTPGDVMLITILGSQMGFQVSEGSRVATESSGVRDTISNYMWLRKAGAQQASSSIRARKTPRRLSSGVVFDGVRFKYPGARREVISNLTLSIPAGSSLAIVGANGAGKSSLVKLLTGCYEPCAGEILIDGRPLSSLDISQWRRHLAVVFQDYLRAELVLREAVGLGDLQRIGDENAVMRALAQAHCQNRYGLDAQLGGQWEGGHKLSAGEWQAIAVARALMRERPLMLLLDESSSALDAPTERLVLESCIKRARTAASETGTIVVVITHRIAAARLADNIAVLDNGQLVELGPHDVLLRRRAQYAGLFTAQERPWVQ